MARRASISFLTALLLFGAACTTTKDTDDTSPVLEAKDPKTLTLQLGDLPDGSSEGDLTEVTPENLESVHSAKKIDDGQHAQLADADFKGMASHSFTYGQDGSVVSNVIVFESEAAAKAYYAKGFPAPDEAVTVKKISDAPKFGEESFSEFLEAPGETSPGQQVVSGQTIRTRARIDNVVIEVLVSEDVRELDEDEAFSITRSAAAKIR